MGKHAVFSIGRGQDADIPLDDETVSRRHAEVTLTSDGKYYFADCNSSGGSYLLKDAAWVPLQQSFVEKTDQLQLGHYQLSVQELAMKIQEFSASAGSGTGNKPGSGAEWNAKDELPSGPVRRDSSTGEIIGDEE